jgi:hypothetical protein
MMQTGMNGARVNKVGKGHLVNTPQPLVIGVGYDIKNQRMIDSNKTIDRVVDDFSGGWHVAFLLRVAGKTTIAEVIKLNLKTVAGRLLLVSILS